MPIEHPGHRAAEVAEKVPPIRNLDSLGRAAPNAVGVSTGAVARDDLDAGMAVQPRPNCLGIAVGQHVDGTVALEIDDKCRRSQSSGLVLANSGWTERLRRREEGVAR